ncbi:hypothetical protein B4U80_08820 [Leptotrombidium deliense]|uniref:RRM domain-containing protein n=1 Tax=Leptotrombidium deliense TaxID=299467 RepID=A0A443S178_9ACAR|nr:hypothetical protein B4U80_08820 [Leptotrombidium deliense]
MVRGVIVVKNFPHGFYEQEIFDYFSQFGKVTRVRHLRNRKTHHSKKVAFVEFDCVDVAKIAAESMDNYLMFDHLMKCQFVPENKVPPNVFKNWNNPMKMTSVKRHRLVFNEPKSSESELKSRKLKLRRIREATELLKSFGIEYQCTVIGDNTSMNSSDTDTKMKKKEVITPLKSKKNRRVDVFELKQSYSEKKCTPKTPRMFLKRSLPKFRLLQVASRRSL